MSTMTRRLALVALLAVAVTACGKHRVATQPDLPPLAAPTPPPRVVTPPEPEEQPPAPAPEPARRTPRRPPPKNEAAPAPKVEPPKAPPAKPDTIAPPPETQPPSTLQIKPGGSQQNLEEQARTLLRQARADLGQIKPKSLNADGKAQFETATRFVEQADQALKDQNFVLAQRLADKAATIAAVLAGR